MAIVNKQDNPTRIEQKQQTRERLISAAIDIFRKVGFQAATVNMIVTAAKTSRPTFYANFKDKAEICFTIAGRIISTVEKIFNQLDDIDNPTQKQVVAWMLDVEELMKSQTTLVDAASSLVIGDHDAALLYLQKMRDHALRCMPRHLACMNREEQNLFLSKFLMLRMMQEKLFLLTLVRGAQFPMVTQQSPVELLAHMWWRELFEDKHYDCDARQFTDHTIQAPESPTEMSAESF